VTEHVDVVFLDVGGVIYSDAPYERSLKLALREMGAAFTDDEYTEAYEECRRAQQGSFRRRLARRFLGSEDRVQELAAWAAPHWRYDPEALFPDAAGCVRVLRERYRLGLIANQLESVRDALQRDGLADSFEVWAISEEIGFEKPDPRLYERALREADVEPTRAVMCGDRLDYDIVPAKRIGMKTVWILQGEAPDEPTEEQLDLPQAFVRSLRDLPAMIENLL
jgi:HAD superfamily hydrolase (TIGR01549 family)